MKNLSTGQKKPSEKTDKISVDRELFADLTKKAEQLNLYEASIITYETNKQALEKANEEKDSKIEALEAEVLKQRHAKRNFIWAFVISLVINLFTFYILFQAWRQHNP